MLNDMIGIHGIGFECPVCGRFHSGPLELWWCPYCGQTFSQKAVQDLNKLTNRVDIIEQILQQYEMDLNEDL